MSSVLVTGGAGYIGSHTVHLLVADGRDVVVLDNLSYGHREALVDDGVTLVEGDMGDEALMERVFSEHDISAVIHFAAFTYVGESVTQPLKYYRNNTAAPLVLLEAMRRHDCKIFIFSSTCATYGEPQYMPLDEQHQQLPINAYGQSKLALERALVDCDTAFDLRSARLRYFNACGALPELGIGEDHDPETHLIPLVLQTLTGQRESISIFGTDYDTPDGTCIRDYIHVVDLGQAHIAALKRLEQGHPSFACNLGTGTGTSVREIIQLAEKVTGMAVPVVEGERRAGDPPRLVANNALASELLGWTPQIDVEQSIADAWAWMTGPHQGHFPKS